MRGLTGIACLGTVLLLAGAAAAFPPQTDQQQKCVNKVNKAVTKVQAAQGKVNAGCVKAFVKGKLPGVNAAENCLLDDVKDNVEAKQAKVLVDETANCLAGQLPDFGYTDGTSAGLAAYQAEVDLIHDVFGAPVDNGLWLCDPYGAECQCQRQTIDRVEKLFRAMSKLWLKCKRPALVVGKDPFPLGAASEAELAQCLYNGSIPLSVQADTKGKVANGTQQLTDTINQFCAGPFNQQPFAASVCSGLSGTNLANCFANQAKCRFCKMIQTVDNLGANVNCAMWSGAVSCP
jgi:hypothetical protein